MAKGSGTTRSVGSNSTGAARQHSVAEYRDYYNQQRAGAMSAFSNGNLTEEQYIARMIQLSEREKNATGSSTVPQGVKDLIEKRIQNTVNHIKGDVSIGSVTVQIDKAKDSFREGIYTERQANRIIEAGKKKIEQLKKNK